MNKAPVLTGFSLGAAVLVSCINFPVRFERIEGDAFRPLTAVFKPQAEAAPGDTLTMVAHFAGNPVRSIDSLQITYRPVRNIFEAFESTLTVDTFTNLDPLRIVDSTHYLPDSLIVRFVIPDTVLREGLSGQLDQLPMSPEQRREISNLIATFSSGSIDPSVIGAVPDSVLDGMIIPALQTLGTRANVFITATSRNGTTLPCRYEFTVRYHSRFQDIPVLADRLAVNRNPAIRWMGIYRVEGKNVRGFHPSKKSFRGKYALDYLYHAFDSTLEADTIVIDTGYTYFMAADSGIMADAPPGEPDTTRDLFHLITPEQDTLLMEEFYYRWFYRNLDKAELPLDSLFVIAGGGTSIARMLPSLDTSMRRFKVWLAVYDELIGDYKRPRGMTVLQEEGVLRYTKAYRDKVANR